MSAAIRAAAGGMSLLRCSEPLDPADPSEDDDERIVARALAILARRVIGAEPMSDPHNLAAFLTVRYGRLGHECFCVVFMDVQNRVLAAEEMFRGTVSQTSVYPREIARRALELNASAVVVAHNHPSGCTEPSAADNLMTSTLRRALALIDVRLLDHFVLGAGNWTSMAQRGLL